MKTYDLIKKEGTFVKESLVVLWVRLLTKLKQVETW
jgi:hypothetical protein